MGHWFDKAMEPYENVVMYKFVQVFLSPMALPHKNSKNGKKVPAEIGQEQLDYIRKGICYMDKKLNLERTKRLQMSGEKSWEDNRIDCWETIARYEIGSGNRQVMYGFYEGDAKSYLNGDKTTQRHFLSVFQAQSGEADALQTAQTRFDDISGLYGQIIEYIYFGYDDRLAEVIDRQKQTIRNMSGEIADELLERKGNESPYVLSGRLLCCLLMLCAIYSDNAPRNNDLRQLAARVLGIALGETGTRIAQPPKSVIEMEFIRLTKMLMKDDFTDDDFESIGQIMENLRKMMESDQYYEEVKMLICRKLGNMIKMYNEKMREGLSDEEAADIISKMGRANKLKLAYKPSADAAAIE